MKLFLIFSRSEIVAEFKKSNFDNFLVQIGLFSSDNRSHSFDLDKINIILDPLNGIAIPLQSHWFRIENIYHSLESKQSTEETLPEFS